MPTNSIVCLNFARYIRCSQILDSPENRFGSQFVRTIIIRSQLEYLFIFALSFLLLLFLFLIIIIWFFFSFGSCSFAFISGCLWTRLDRIHETFIYYTLLLMRLCLCVCVCWCPPSHHCFHHTSLGQSIRRAFSFTCHHHPHPIGRLFRDSSSFFTHWRWWAPPARPNSFPPHGPIPRRGSGRLHTLWWTKACVDLLFVVAVCRSRIIESSAYLDATTLFAIVRHLVISASRVSPDFQRLLSLATYSDSAAVTDTHRKPFFFFISFFLTLFPSLPSTIRTRTPQTPQSLCNSKSPHHHSIACTLYSSAAFGSRNHFNRVAHKINTQKLHNHI